jgi:Mn2+/Fe2+ NRAMP family transporter
MTSATAHRMLDKPRRDEPLPGVRRGADVTFAVVQALFVAAVLAQVFLAGLGAFTHRSTGSHPFAAHEDLGNILGIVAVALFVIAVIARASTATVVGALVLGVLTEAAQHGLAQGGHHHAWLGGLHALDGMIILLLGTWLAIAAYRRVR